MHPIVFNFTNSKLDYRMEAIALKVAYLLCDQMLTAGSSGRDMFAKTFLSNLNPSREAEFLVNFYKNKDPDLYEAVLDSRQKLKQAAKVKHKNSQFLAMQKKLEQMIHKFWMNVVDNYHDFMTSFGFDALRPLTEEDTFGYLRMNNDPEEGGEEDVTASELLQRFLQTEDTVEKDEMIELFFLGGEFLAKAYPRPAIYTITDEEAKNINNIYLHHAFTLPYINELSTAELQVVRGQLRTEGTDFRQQTDAWILKCYDGADTADRIAAFARQVLPAAALLQQQIESNHTLQLCSQQYNDRSKTEVWMGELPVWQLWEFYHYYHVINDVTWDKLQNVKDKEDYKDQRWPIMMLKMPEPDAPGEPDEEIKASKKYLLID